MALPVTPPGSGSVIVATVAPAGGVNYTQLLYSGADAARLFQAWQNKAGPRDPSSNAPIGTVAQFTAYCAQLIQNQLMSYVTVNEQTVPAAPGITATNS